MTTAINFKATATTATTATAAPKNGLAALKALKTAIRGITPPSAARVRKVGLTERRATRLALDLQLLKDGTREITKEGQPTRVKKLGPVHLLAIAVQASKRGASIEQLSETGIASRFHWSSVTEMVQDYVLSKGASWESLRLVLGIVEAEQSVQAEQSARVVRRASKK